MTTEQLCRKAEYLYETWLRSHRAVSNVLVKQLSDNKDYLTDKQRKRNTEVREMLAKGENPFAKPGDTYVPKAVTLTPEELRAVMLNAQRNKTEKQSTRIIHEKTTEEVKALEEFWQSGVGSKPPVEMCSQSADEAFGYEEPTPPRDPSKHYCSFCGREIDPTNMTLGTGSKLKRITIETTRIVGTTFETTEQTKYVTNRIKACPDCALLIQPTIDNDQKSPTYGKLVKNNVRFPETKG